MAQGLANSQRLAEFEARSAAAAASEQGRAAARLPIGVAARRLHADQPRHRVLGLRTRAGRGRSSTRTFRTTTATRVDLQWPIYTAGRLDALERAARAEHDATGEDLAAARADLRLEITRAFWALVTAREAEQVVAKALDSDRRARRATCARASTRGSSLRTTS